MNIDRNIKILNAKCTETNLKLYEAMGLVLKILQRLRNMKPVSCPGISAECLSRNVNVLTTPRIMPEKNTAVIYVIF
jgi:hypothetical protein